MLVNDLQYRKRRNGSEVTLTFDDNSSLALDAELAVQFHLASGMEISREKLIEIKIADELLRAKRRLIQYLALRKKSTGDARLYLKKLRFSSGIIDRAIEYATEMKYLDDNDFAEAFTRTRMKAATKGPRAVANDLQAHGISRDDAKKAVESLAEPGVQIVTARRVAAKKFPILKEYDDLTKASRKLTQHLARRGFDPDICESVTQEFFGEPTQY